jgi:predicted MFS family arabinose efflux permease
MQAIRSRQGFTLTVLLAVNLLNFYDRQVLGAVGEPLRKDLGLNDTLYGLLTTAFTLTYAVAGVPLGRWADVGRRTHILAAGVAVWSVFTMLSAAAWNYASLFVVRLGVGIGEASCAPAANSLVGDLFPRERRARALAVFMLGLPLGLSLSSVVSGRLAQYWDWRVALLVAGLPGLVVAIFCLRLPESARGASEHHAVGATRREGNPVLQVLRIPTMWWLIVSGALHNFNMYALGSFLAPFLQRYYELNVRQANDVCGAAYACGGLGLFVGGWACDRVVRTRISGRLEVSAGALALSTGCFVVALVQPGGVWGFAAWLLPACFFLYVYYSGVYATIQDIVEPTLRGTAMAMYFFAFYLIGAAQGPLLTGWVSDTFARRAAEAAGAATIEPIHRAIGLHDALGLIPLLSVALVVVLLIASRTVRGDYQRLQKWMQSTPAAPL